MQLNFKPGGVVGRDFMRDDSFFRGLRGPVGGGKSVNCAIEIFRRASQQKPGPDGKRRSRWAVVRNTNPQLKTTTIKTWLDWFKEEHFGTFMWSVPYTHYISVADIELEVIFLALDKPEDVRKLLSLELTGVWINEAREVPKAIVDACTMRVGRYPSMKDGGPTWYGVIADTNAPDEDHWWPIMAGEAPVPDHFTPEQTLMLVKPDNWRFFNQPPAMLEQRTPDGVITGYEINPDAENAQNLTPDYYPNMIRGKTKQWIDVYVLNKLGSIADGKPVYPTFSAQAHVSKVPLIPIVHLPVWIGLDFGLTPAAVFGQRPPRGQWLIQHELVCTDMGVPRFAELLKSEIAGKYAGCTTFYIYGDPSGDSRTPGSADESTVFQILRAAGITALPTWTNDPTLRIGAVEAPLGRMCDGGPGFLIDPSCKTLIRGFEGGYHYRRLQVSGAERTEEKPDKNKYSHPHDALQYLMLGGGEGAKLVGHGGRVKTVVARTGFDVQRNGRRDRKGPFSWLRR